uniref:Uncharacterized protein n=1 Tax=Glycine max TaxID=3847 RepID=K7KIM3_SOYBN
MFSVTQENQEYERSHSSMEYQNSERKMENMISNITRKYEEGWQICFIFYTKGKMDKIKYNPEMQNGAVDGWEVISEVTTH